MKQLFMFSFSILLSLCSSAQIDVGGIVKRKAEQKATEKIEKGVDKVFDETEEGVKDASKTDKKSKDKKKGETTTEEGATENAAEEEGGTASSAEKKSLKTYSKFDFVQGEKIIVEDNFNHVTVGDFPAEWNTNSGGEIVTVDGMEGKWLQISKEGVFMPDYITDLPENFTMQFDVICNEDFNFYSSALHFTFIPTSNRQKLNEYGIYSHPAHGVRVGMHPTGAGNTEGSMSITNWDSSGEELLRNEVGNVQFFAKESNIVRVSIWRQKQRVRIYFNEEKVLDVPRAFDATAKYNAMTMCFGGSHQDQDKYLLSNMRLAVGAPDTRSKLITEGKLVTRGILFDSGSDKIKAESYGTLKDIATVLNENPDVKVKIIGHTDSDGEDAANLELSKKRAAAVKEALTKEFAIDASRMETDGKGESTPTDKNDTSAGKANNRRVEFVKL
ncbi:MAG: OmpA family protein [Flavobacteriales bacterium]